MSPVIYLLCLSYQAMYEVLPFCFYMERYLFDNTSHWLQEAHSVKHDFYVTM